MGGCVATVPSAPAPQLPAAGLPRGGGDGESPGRPRARWQWLLQGGSPGDGEQSPAPKRPSATGAGLPVLS